MKSPALFLAIRIHWALAIAVPFTSGCDSSQSLAEPHQESALELNTVEVIGEGTQARVANKPDLRSQDSKYPVTCSIGLQKDFGKPGTTTEVSVHLTIESPYEINDLDAPFPAIATELELKLPEGFQEIGDWNGPEPIRSSAPDGHAVHLGNVTFSKKISIGDEVPPAEYAIGAAVRYQACNGTLCLRPEEFELSTSIEVQ